MNRSVNQYLNNKSLELQIESVVLGSYIAINMIIMTIILLFSYIFGVFAFKNSIKSAKELKEYSEKISKIVGKDIKCYVIKDKLPNAYNAGGSNCYITKPLLNMLNEKETIAILLHEYGHYQKLHLFKAFGVQVSSSILLSAVFNILSATFLYVVHPIFSILGMIFGKRISDYYAKMKEFEADEVATKYGYSKEVVSALKKLEKYTKADVCKKLNKKDCEVYFADFQSKSITHPPFKERYERILNSPLFHKTAFYFASKISSSDEVSISLLDKIKNVINKLIEKIS